MSFRYTNNLIGALKYRLQLEAAHRAIARRTFIGTCSGIEVTCSGYGTVLAIQLRDKARWSAFYSLPLANQMSRGAAAAAATSDHDGRADRTRASSTAGDRVIDLERVAVSIKAAVWEASRMIYAAKSAAHHNALTQNTQLLAHGTLRHWYEHSPTTMYPRPCDALKNEAATPWMQAVRFGKTDAASRYTPRGSSSAAAARATRVTVLEDGDCNPLNIPIGAVHPLLTAGLVQLEQAAADRVTGNRSRIDTAVVRRQRQQELSHDERAFWDRVELIRRGQLATIPGGVKRNYADQAATIKDDTEDKVALRLSH